MLLFRCPPSVNCPLVSILTYQQFDVNTSKWHQLQRHVLPIYHWKTTSLAWLFFSIWHNWSSYPCTCAILTLDLLILSFYGFHLIWLIVHTTSLYLIIALLLLLYTQVFLRVRFLAICFSPCILSLCLPLLTHTLSYIICWWLTITDVCSFR